MGARPVMLRPQCNQTRRRRVVCVNRRKPHDILHDRGRAGPRRGCRPGGLYRPHRRGRQGRSGGFVQPHPSCRLRLCPVNRQKRPRRRGYSPRRLFAGVERCRRIPQAGQAYGLGADHHPESGHQPPAGARADGTPGSGGLAGPSRGGARGASSPFWTAIWTPCSPAGGGWASWCWTARAGRSPLCWACRSPRFSPNTAGL